VITLPGALHAHIRQGGTAVLPSRQRAHAARLAYAAASLSAGHRVWATPDVLAIDGWLRREIERLAMRDARLPRLLTQAEEWWLWRQCTAEATSELPLLNRGALAEALRRSGELAFNFCIDRSSGAELGGEELAVARRVDDLVHERSRTLGAATLTAMPDHASWPGPALPAVFRGFLPPTPRLDALSALQGPTKEPEPLRTRPHVVIAADEDEELERIAEWCRTQIAKDPTARLLVMLPGTAGRRERLATQVHQALDPGGWLRPGPEDRQRIVIEGGQPLAQLPAVGHALAALSWLAGCLPAPTQATLPGQWLNAPYWRGSAACRALLAGWLRERRGPGLEQAPGPLIRQLGQAPAALKVAAAELVSQITVASAALEHSDGSPREWAMRLDLALTALGWPGERPRDSGEQQTVVRFRGLLDELGSLAVSTGPVTRESAIQWLTELAERTAFRPADEDPVVTITPQLIDPVVRYDGVWVAGLHAGGWPLPVQPDPYIPLQKQLKAGVPQASAKGRLGEAQALLAAWRAATLELRMSAPARAEDLELLPSPLLTPWRSAEPPRVSTRLWLPYRMHREGLLDSLADPVGMRWPAGRALPSGTRSLELQNQCPFRAYAELRLACGERPAAQELGIAPELRGHLLHGALQRLWKLLKNSGGLAAQEGSGLAALIKQCVSEALEALRGRESQPGSAAAFEREARRAERLIARLCELERERAPFTVAATELATSLTLGGWPLNVRIDRVDALSGGGRAILDYKSGRRVAADWYGERPSHPQLLAYLAALPEEVVALATVNVNAREVRFEGVARVAGLLPEVKAALGATPEVTSEEAWRLRQRDWLARIEQLAVAFGAGQASVEPRPGACKLCHLMSLCRIADRGHLPAAASPARS
jgi:probable DNA repair protein